MRPISIPVAVTFLESAMAACQPHGENNTAGIHSHTKVLHDLLISVL